MPWTTLDTASDGQFRLTGGTRTMPARLRVDRAELDRLAAEGRLTGEARSAYERLTGSTPAPTSGTPPVRRASEPSPPRPRTVEGSAFARSIRAAGDFVAQEMGLGPHPEAKDAAGDDFQARTRRIGDELACAGRL